jgi:enoyl-CoA hydratase/carnithine racemase
MILSVTCLSYLKTRSVNEVVPRGKAVNTAISWALKICENSPDAVQATKHGLMLGLLRGGVEEAFTSHVWSEASKKVWAGENIKVSCIRDDLVPEQ